MIHHLDYWIPAAGLIMSSAGLAYLIACKFRPTKREPDISDYKLAPIDLNAPLEGATRPTATAFIGKCDVCGLDHERYGAGDSNKQACIDALLSKMPKRGGHGRFAK